MTDVLRTWCDEENEAQIEYSNHYDTYMYIGSINLNIVQFMIIQA